MNLSQSEFAADTFFTAAGKLDISSREPLTVAFIGGSLTEGEIDYEGTSLDDKNLKWANVIIKFLSGLFPFRPITAVNAGLGGTESNYGAARFARDILSHKPDLVFIEFSCNDRPYKLSECNDDGKAKRQIYLESMIRQCMEASKVPAIVYMHVPMPLLGEELDCYYRGCEFKQEVLDHYEIGTVNAMADFINEYRAQSVANPQISIEDYYCKYYERHENGLYNVHPRGSGYLLFAQSLINAITREPERYLRPFKMKDDVYCKGYETEIGERYNYIHAASERITYEGEWQLYTAENPFVSGDPEILIREKSYKRKQNFPKGVMQTYKPRAAAFSFETEADRVCMPHVSAKAGLSATVYADGIKVGETSCQSRWHGMNYTGPWITLPKGKKRLRFVIEDASDTAYVFRFGNIIEAFRK